MGQTGLGPENRQMEIVVQNKERHTYLHMLASKEVYLQPDNCPSKKELGAPFREGDIEYGSTQLTERSFMSRKSHGRSPTYSEEREQLLTSTKKRHWRPERVLGQTHNFFCPLLRNKSKAILEEAQRLVRNFLRNSFRNP